MSEEIKEMDKEYKEEKRAELVVEKECENCIYGENKGCLRCSGYLGMAMFEPSQSAIDAKVEELRVKGAVGIQAVIENGTRFTCGSIGCLLDTPSVGTKSDCRCLTELNFADKLKVGRYIQREKALKKEMLECLKDLVNWNSESTSKDLGEICDEAEKLIEKVEGK